MADIKSAYRTSVGKTEGKKPQRRLRHMWGVILK
jgi:hypothetical protein